MDSNLGRQVSARWSVECFWASTVMVSYFSKRCSKGSSRYRTGNSRTHSGVGVSRRMPATQMASPYFVETDGYALTVTRRRSRTHSELTDAVVTTVNRRPWEAVSVGIQARYSCGCSCKVQERSSRRCRS